ncbi:MULTISPECIES: ECF transporter S component [unclassified Sedimentibacter]|uniref:ECF transporter S component n=1 Tax=unclassified Sedimentibacter TaxID=2649220 RepID=UPI0027DFC0EF|nr:ECF transporter S component [Sedimentibacter sp. MB35-C1]WMJ78548.1 ECF transporter S component [Sedimentibacter sp. MB35-C1]
MNRKFETSKLTFLGVMLALTIVFVALTAIPTTSASMALLLFLPTIITSVILGPKSGAVMGALAGFATLIRALTAPASPLDYLFLNPLVAVLPRIFIGVIPYYIFKLFNKIIKNETVSLLAAGVSGALTNTGLVIFMLYVVYSDEIVRLSTEFGIGTTFAAFAIFLVTTSALIESTAAGVGTAAVVKVYNKINR